MYCNGCAGDAARTRGASMPNQVDARRYLKRFGYLKDPVMPEVTAESVAAVAAEVETAGMMGMQSAIMDFQRFARLQVTGQLDEPTRKHMALSRCAMADSLLGPETMAIAAPFVATGTAWKKGIL